MATKAKTATNFAKENVSRNIGKLTTASLASAMDLVKSRTAPLTTRSKTVTDIKANLQSTAASSSAVVSAAVIRKPITTRPGPPARKPVAAPTRTVAGKPALTATKSAEPAVNKAKPAAPKRIPPYDYKARFNDLTEKHKVLREKHDNLREQLSVFDDLPEKYEQGQIDLAAVKAENMEFRAVIEALEKDNLKMRQETTELNQKVTSLSERVAHFEDYCPKLELEISNFKERFSATENENVALKSHVEHLKSELVHCADQLFNTNAERKTLHNEVSLKIQKINKI